MLFLKCQVLLRCLFGNAKYCSDAYFDGYILAVTYIIVVYVEIVICCPATAPGDQLCRISTIQTSQSLTSMR